MEAPLIREQGKPRSVPTRDAIATAVAAIKTIKSPERLAVVISPWFTNEDAYLIGKLLTGPLKGAGVFMGGRADGDGDDVLIRADKNPNRKGVATIMAALGVSFEPLSKLSSDHDLALVFGDNHTLGDETASALQAIKRRVVFGLFMTPLWETADVFLPTRTPWEKDGSYTNFEGVVQRIDRASKATSTCKSEGYYAMKILQALGGDVAYGRPDEVLSGLAGEVPAFQGMTRAGLGPHGIKLGNEGASA